MTSTDHTSHAHNHLERFRTVKEEWPGFNLYRKILCCPWEIVEQLAAFRRVLLSNLKDLESYIGRGGFDVCDPVDCDCDVKPLDPKQVHIEVANLGSNPSQNELRNLLDRVPLGNDARRTIRETMVRLYGVACLDEIDEAEAVAWLHHNHRGYNKAVRQLIITTVGLAVFRAILVRDLAATDDPEWGHLLRKSYAQAVIANFIDSEEWC
ncbi:MAG: hypothetical protein WC702_01380 [Patescibacteria group bacterium]|jgi:hypothetical protein